MENPPAHHFEKFTRAAFGAPLVPVSDAPPPDGAMDPEQRLWLLHEACSALLERPEETDYLVTQSGHDWCHSVNLMYLGGLINVEVNPRHWDPCPICHNAPLNSFAIEALRELGFTGGQPGTNFRLDGLSPEPLKLAGFIDRLFHLAYGEPADFPVGVRFRHGDVAERFLERTGGSRWVWW